MEFYTKTAQETASILGTSLDGGLSESGVAESFKKHGSNMLSRKKREE